MHEHAHSSGIKHAENAVYHSRHFTQAYSDNDSSQVKRAIRESIGYGRWGVNMQQRNASYIN